MRFKSYFLSAVVFLILLNFAFADSSALAIVEFDYDAPAEGNTTVKAKLDRPIQYRYNYLIEGEGDWVYRDWSGIFQREIEFQMAFPRRRIINWYVELRDEAGDVTRTQTYEVSSYVYLRGNININDGSLTTASREVTLQLRAFDLEFEVTQMCFSNDGKNWSAWETFAPTKAWQLSEGEGQKTVYARFKDSAGFQINRALRDSIYYTTTPAPGGSSRIQIRAGQLLVDNRPYKIKGVAWARWPYQLQNLYRQDIALMKEMGVNTVRVVADPLDSFQLYTEILNELQNNGIMVIMFVDYLRNAQADLEKIERIVTAFKSHPAILAWQIGDGSADPLGLETEKAAARIKQLDPSHPVVRILDALDIYSGKPYHFIIPSGGEDGWGFNVETFVAKSCPSVDIWGINYMNDNDTFGGLFYEWAQVCPKPMFISMAGRRTLDPTLDQEKHALGVAALWSEVYFHLSADRPEQQCLGMAYYPWNNDYLGLVADNLSKRQAYFKLGDGYIKGGQAINLNWDIKLKAVSANYAEFTKDDRLFYSRFGGGGGGRGLNLAIIDPNTGLLEEVRNFDTRADSYDLTFSALVQAKNYIAKIPAAKIIMASIAEDGGLTGDAPQVEELRRALESIGSNLIRNVRYSDTWAMLSVKGMPGNLAEGHYTYTEEQGKTPVEIERTVALAIDVDKDGRRDDIDTNWDNDGLSNNKEIEKGTDPLDPDSDDDGVWDRGAEDMLGDIDQDDDVDFGDFIEFASAFGAKVGDTRYNLLADLDQDNEIDFNDFFIFADQYGKTRSSSSPASS